MEKDIFKKSIVDFDKLVSVGFKKEHDTYVYEKKFLNNDFKAIINISSLGVVTGKVIDLLTDEEYNNIRTEMQGEFVSKVRNEYKNILIDIREHAFNNKYFISDQANRITKYLNDKYLSVPEFLWDNYDDGVFRNLSSNKWYAIIMKIDLSKIDNGHGEIEILNVKLDRDEITNLLNRKGFYKAYHMNKKDWITIILNNTLTDNEIISLIDKSYNLVK